MSIDYLERLRAVAEAAEGEEAKFRQESQKRLAVLTELRARAYRRYNLIREMTELARPIAELEPCVEAQCARVLAEAEWTEADAAYKEVETALSRLARAIHADLHGDAGAPAMAMVSVADALEEFEAWYRGRFGNEFPALRPLDAPNFQSLVDF